MKSKIILPLDGVTLEEAIVIVGKTKDLVWGYKVNTLLLKEGFKIISILKDFGVKVMVDPKLYDIPHTMNTYIENLLNSRADIITVHASAMYSPASNQKSILAGVTILTSFNQESFEQVFNEDEILCQKVLQFAKFCQKKEYGYVVCSPRELVTLNSLYIKKICPGIRPKWYQQEDDQVRTMTPAESIRAGADLMVMGRPILHAKDMSEALKKTNSEIEEVLETKLRRGDMIEDKVKELVATCLDIEISEIDMENTMIEDLGAAELDLTDLLVSLEAEFGIKIDDDRFGEINRIDQLVECVKELKEKE